MAETHTRGGAPECVPARILNEFVYCPRLAYIEWVQADFADNYETADGRLKHTRVDREGGDMPSPDEEAEAFHARSVWLSAVSERLTARMDLIEGNGRTVTVVDYKRGSGPDPPGEAWDTDSVQLCAQGLILRANGYGCDSGIVYYAGSRRRVAVEFTADLVEKTRNAVKDLIAVAESGRIPPPLEDSPKCVGCSIAGICLPDEINMLAGRVDADSTGDEPVRRLTPARDTAIPLYVQHQGARIGKQGERLLVKDRKESLGEVRLFETSQLAIFGNVQVTTQALREMCVRNIPVVLFSTGGWFYGMAHGLAHKNVELRQAQYKAASEPETCLRFARSFVEAKIRNCRTMLMRNHPDLPPDVTTRLAGLADRAGAEENAESLLGIEGAAARIYFGVFDGMFKTSKRSAERCEWSFDMSGRNRRPPLDPVNTMLSYAYALLVKEFTVTAQAVGLDPFLGFLHRPRYGRPALALDLMEEFRPIVADSVVIAAANTGVVSPGDFVRRGTAVSFRDSGRKKFIQAYERRMDTLVTHPLFGYRISYRRVLEVQTRLLGRALTGELDGYTPFRTR